MKKRKYSLKKNPDIHEIIGFSKDKVLKNK
jgi:hypothetical protein